MVLAGLIFTMLLWGGSFIAIKIGLQYLSPVELVLARFIPSTVLLLPIGLIVSHKDGSTSGFWKSLSSREIVYLVCGAVLAVPGYHLCLNKGETIIPAGWASLVISLNPACITIFAALGLREQIGFKRWLGIVVAFSGLLFIALTHDVLSDGGLPLSSTFKILGMIITLGAVISWGGFTVISKRLITGRQPLIVLAWSISLGTFLILPLISGDFLLKMASGPARLWWSVAYLSIGCTVVAFIVWFWALGKWQASRAGSFIYLVPIIALLSGRWMLNEPLDVSIMIGTVLVLGGVVFAGTNAENHNQRSV